MVSDQWEVIKCRLSGEAIGLVGPEEPLPLRMITFGGDEWAVSSTVVAFLSLDNYTRWCRLGGFRIIRNIDIFVDQWEVLKCRPF